MYHYSMLRCDLCEHNCQITPGGTGMCRVRGDVGGRVGLLTYGEVTTAVIGPIEQKLIYHFRPGMRVLTLGGAGCNLSCAYCQNFEISQTRKKGTSLLPRDVPAMAGDACGVAFSYSEPLVLIEYVQDVFIEARRAGLATIMKTNGLCNERAFRGVMALTDAVNIDVKGPRALYSEVCGLGLGPRPADWPMIRNLAAAAALCEDVEASIVAIPGYYGDDGEVRELLGAIHEAAPKAPLHVLRFIPDFRMRDVPPTPMDEMRRLESMAGEFFDHVYLDFAGLDNDTKCQCGAMLVSRAGLVVTRDAGAICGSCGRPSVVKGAANAVV